MSPKSDRKIVDEAIAGAKNPRARIGSAILAALSVTALAVAGVSLWTGRADEADRADTAEAAVDRSDPVIAELVDECQAGRPGRLPAGLTCAEVRRADVAIEDVGEVQDPEVDDPDPDDPERQNPEHQNPDPDDPERQNPEHQNPEDQDLDSDDPEAQDPEVDDPENQDPEVDDPDPDDPENQDPEVDDPDPNDQPISPYPFTFTLEFMGMTWTCLIDGPDNNPCVMT